MQLQALLVEQKSRDGGLDLPHKGWGLQELLVVPGAANLIYCSCCRFGTCGWKFLSVRGAANLATAVGCSFSTGAGSSCVT